MQPRTIYIILNVVLLTAMLWLAGHVRKPYDELDGYFIKAVEKDNDLQRASILHWKQSIACNFSLPGQSEKVKPYGDIADHIDSAVNFTLSQIAADKIVAMRADTLQALYNGCRNFILGTMPQDSATLSPFLPDMGKEFSGIAIKDNKWMRYIATLPAGKKDLLVSLVHNSLLVAQCMATKRMVALSNPHDLRYDSVAVIALGNSRTFQVAEKVRVSLILAAVNPYVSNVVFYYNNRVVNINNKVGKAAEPVRYAGRHNMAGYCGAQRYCKDYTDSFFWSLSYSAIGRGIALRHQTNQLVYRYYSNPITVNIPGYPADKITLHAKNALLRDMGSGRWTITPGAGCGDTVVLYADATDASGHTASVHSTAYKVVGMPVPSLSINGYLHTIPISQLTGEAELKASYVDDLEFNYTVAGFHVLVVDAAGKEVGEYTVKGGRLLANKQLAAVLLSLTPGARLFITNCITSACGAIEVQAYPLSITVN